ncbi:esterase [Streptomyces albireticuli]|uniref:Esterase n=1 Tax=Streptomyces albireticuli TaxID=1940 RepID=A0A1Z2L7Y9_9ACTN|nr:S1 family peptidase [Streptomyces albireticuli]ARZ70424.1 esterase [Streptomyces albireticuli]
MSAIRPRAAWMTGILASAVAASLLTGVPAHAVVGEEAADGAYAFTAQLDIDEGARGCSAALVEQEWLVTAASCFADDPAKSFKISAGTPKRKTTATIGRTDLSGKGGGVVDVVELVPREDRDLVMARLARPVTGVKPAHLNFDTILPGEHLRVAGYGRTKDEWVPDRLHSAGFDVESAKGGTVRLKGRSADAAACQGDTGGPVFKDLSGHYELVGITSTSGQAGCFGTDGSETRRGVQAARVDDIAGWIQATASRGVLSRADWKNAVHVVSGNFTRGIKHSDRSDVFVVWADGSASIFRGADHTDDKYPFMAEYKVAAKGSYWKDAAAVTGTRVTDAASSGSATDGLTVRWKSGKLSTFTHVDTYGFFEEKTLAYSGSWKNARLITAGRHTANKLRDDLVVLWADGSTSMYSDTGVNGVAKETQLTKADKAWTEAAQISSAEFTGGGTADLVVSWKSGKAELFAGLDTDGFHGSTVLRKAGSAWRYATTLTPGVFGGRYPGDLLVRWADGNLSYYSDVDTSGTHAEVQLVG